MLAQKRENPMSVRSKSALAQSLLRMMIDKPFDEISISDITERAGLSRQTFYTNFIKKEDILKYLLNGLFFKYASRVKTITSAPSNIIVDYFIFWDENKDFLQLLFRHGLGHLFMERNREFFAEDIETVSEIFTAETWQKPYIKAMLAGITYELLLLWMSSDQGLSVGVLTNMAEHMLDGSVFAD